MNGFVYLVIISGSLCFNSVDNTIIECNDTIYCKTEAQVNEAVNKFCTKNHQVKYCPVFNNEEEAEEYIKNHKEECDEKENCSNISVERIKKCTR